MVSRLGACQAVAVVLIVLLGDGAAVVYLDYPVVIIAVSYLVYRATDASKPAFYASTSIYTPQTTKTCSL